MKTEETIKRKQNMNNTGGLYKILVCSTTNITREGSIIDQDKLIMINFSDDTGKRECTRKEDKQGTYYDLQVNCKVPRSDQAELLINIFPANFVLITIDTNNIARLEGNKEEPLHVEDSSNTEEKFSDLNHVSLKFYRKLRLSPTIISL